MKPTITTAIPGQPPIELVAYYDEFVNYYPQCEMATKDWFVRHVGDDWVMFDCGANIGYFSILFARLARCGRIYAFEPTSTIEMMRANLAHHCADHVIPLQLALGKESGQRTDAIYRIWGNEAERQAYAFTTIDDFVAAQDLSRVDCIKIDVDSFDFEVLQGAEQTLRRFNPYVMVELNHALSKRNQSNTEALEWMARLGYSDSLVLDYDNFLFKRPASAALPKKQITLSFDSAAELSPVPTAAFPPSPVPIVAVDELPARLGLAAPIAYPETSRAKPLTAWLMEDDDAPIFRYLYCQLQPKRHLEFGTWQGMGTLYCLEESDATVWTLNLPFGESTGDGRTIYSYPPGEREAVQAWAAKLGLPAQEAYRTDSLGFIGRFYLERGLGQRVCQIYADSLQWNTTHFPPGFFDTVLIDGGHSRDVVLNDTQKALQLVRPGGVVLWHDFCPPVYNECESTRGVLNAIAENLGWLTAHTKQLFWIYPSWILLGIRNETAFAPLPDVTASFHSTAYASPKPPPTPSALPVPQHHPVFQKFECWRGTVEAGCQRDFLGVVTPAKWYDLMSSKPEPEYSTPSFPAFDEEYFEWVDVLETVTAADGKFTMLELGAGWGRWLMRAAAALRQTRHLPCRLVGVEAEPTHFEWMKQHFIDNGFDPNEHTLVEAAVAAEDGTVLFEVGAPEHDYGQEIVTASSSPTQAVQSVPAVSLKHLLEPLDFVDLIDLDVQGAELSVLSAAAEALTPKVQRIHIGTHNHAVEVGLRELFTRLGWFCLNDYPCYSRCVTPWGAIQFVDGVQTWVNPRFTNVERLSFKTPSQSAVVRPAAPPSPNNQVAELCARIGRMLERPGPIALEEMQAGAEALGALLSAPDIMAHIAALPRPFPAAMLPLLTINIETALNDGNGKLGLVLTQLQQLLEMES